MRPVVFPPQTDDATIAAYFDLALETLILDEDDIKESAFEIIEAREAPSVVIVEIATARNRFALMDVLRESRGRGNRSLAARWLLDGIIGDLEAGRIPTSRALSAAATIASATDWPLEAQYDLMILADYASLAEDGLHGDVEQVRASALDSLARHVMMLPAWHDPGPPHSVARPDAQGLNRSREHAMNAAEQASAHDRPIDRWLAKYSSDHVNPTNQTIHFFAVPLILWTVTALLWCIPVPGTWFGPGFWAAIAAFAAWMFYYRASRKLGLGMLVVFVAMLWINRGLQIAIGTENLLWLAIAVFVLAWIAQFIGHKIEGRKPSFFTDLVYLMIGPVWTLGKLYRKLGWSY